MTATTLGRRRVGRRDRRRSEGRDTLARVALLLVVVFALLAVFGPLIAPHDPDAVNLLRAYWGPDGTHPLGYDQQGRDLLSRIVVGARSSFLGPLAIVLVASAAGTGLAMVAAWRRGWVDAVLAGVLDASLAFPGILLAVMAVALFGQGLDASVVALGIAYTPYMARIVRSAALQEMGKDYVDALRVQGFSGTWICLRHVVPNVLPILMGQAALTLAWSTVDLAGLSYLGLGVRPPSADWGLMVANGQDGVIAGYPAESLVAGICLLTAVCSFSLLGDRLLRRNQEQSA